MTRTEVRLGRRRIPTARIEAVRVERDGILMPLALIVVFSLLCVNAVSKEDDVGCAVFALGAIVALLASLFPRYVLLLDAGAGDRRVLGGWDPVRLSRIRAAIDGVRPVADRWRPLRAA